MTRVVRVKAAVFLESSARPTEIFGKTPDYPFKKSRYVTKTPETKSYVLTAATDLCITQIDVSDVSLMIFGLIRQKMIWIENDKNVKKEGNRNHAS